jgi:hypothetical protein
LTRPARERVQVAAAVGLGLLSLCLLPWMRSRPAAPPIPLSACVIPVPPRSSPSERARRAGWQYRIRAKLAVEQELEALEAWDPAANPAAHEGRWRRQLLARDRGSDLGRARRAACQAAALARTPGEAYRAALLLAFLDDDAGDHQAELRQARGMMALQPHCQASLGALRHAAWDNGLEPLARQATVALRRMEDSPGPETSVPRSVAGVGRREVPAATPAPQAVRAVLPRRTKPPAAGHAPGGEAGRSRIAPASLECVRLAAAFAPRQWLLPQAREQRNRCPTRISGPTREARPSSPERKRWQAVRSGGPPSQRRASAARLGAKAAASGSTPKSLACGQQRCHGILAHAEEAEDAVQETILRALRALFRFRVSTSSGAELSIHAAAVS